MVEKHTQVLGFGKNIYIIGVFYWVQWQTKDYIYVNIRVFLLRRSELEPTVS